MDCKEANEKMDQESERTGKLAGEQAKGQNKVFKFRLY